MPLKGGLVDMCPPESAHWIVDISDARGTRRFARPCQLVGPVGVIAQLASSLKLAAAVPYREGKPLYAAAPAPAREAMQDFLVAAFRGAILGWSAAERSRATRPPATAAETSSSAPPTRRGR